jgi:hypothetical protein
VALPRCSRLAQTRRYRTMPDSYPKRGRDRAHPSARFTAIADRGIRLVLRHLAVGAELVASTYAPRRWLIIVVGTCLALWLYKSAEHIAHVYVPPSPEGPAVDYVVPITGAQRPIDNEFELHLEVGLKGCQNPVRVLASANGPGIGARNWLRRSALISFGVADQSVRNLRTFDAAESATPEEESKLFDEDFHGNRTLIEIPDKPLAAPSTVLGPGMRGVSGLGPAFTSLEAAPTFYWAFTADWLSPRSYGTCFLALPLVIGPGPGAALVHLPRPPQGQYVGTDSAIVGLSDWTFTEGPEGLLPAPLSVVADDSKPAPAEPTHPEWTCGARGNQTSCNGGYVALSTPNATGNTNTALFLRGALLGVVAALVAESLLRFRRPTPRHARSGNSHTASLPVRWIRRD